MISRIKVTVVLKIDSRSKVKVNHILETILIKSNGLHFRSKISFLNVSDTVYNLSHRESKPSESCFIIKRENVTAHIKEVRVSIYIKSNFNIQLLNNQYFLGESVKF